MKWKKTTTRIYKVNWDVAIDSTNRSMYNCIIGRDYQGQEAAARSHTKSIVPEPMVAKEIAALSAAKFSRDFGLQSIILEGDWSRYVQIVENTKGVLNLLRN